MGLLKRPLRRLRRFVELGWQSRAVVLLYHRVTDLAADPQLLAVTPAHFAEHMQVLRREWRPLHLATLQEQMVAGGITPRSVAVSFDDGYRDNLTEARPLLEQHAVPATVFVATGGVGTDLELWWDELERLLLWTGQLPTELRLQVGGRRLQWSIEAEGGFADDAAARGWTVLQPAVTGRQRAYADLARILHPLDAAAREAIMATLRHWAGADARGRGSHRLLSADEVARLGSGGIVDVGGHTVTHTLLSALDPAEQAREIRAGKDSLEQWLGRPVTSFAYPFGYAASYTAATVAAVRASGFRLACSNFTGPVVRATSAFEMPRFIVRNWDGDTFAGKLTRWARGLD